MHFMSLRCDSHAQLEIRVYADKIAGMVKELFPISFGAWYDYHFNAVNFTRLDRLFLQDVINDVSYDRGLSFQSLHRLDKELNEKAAKLGMSKREITEFWDKIDAPTEQDFSL